MEFSGGCSQLRDSREVDVGISNVVGAISQGVEGNVGDAFTDFTMAGARGCSLFQLLVGDLALLFDDGFGGIEEDLFATIGAAALKGIKDGFLSCYRHAPATGKDDPIRGVIQHLAETHPRWGFGLMFGWMRL